jgi:hypothetical protein
MPRLNIKRAKRIKESTMKEKKQREPLYFVANFGQKHADEHPVDGRCYRVPACYNDSGMVSEGDIMLLCCWAGHRGLSNGDAWGLGKVTSKTGCDGNYDIYYEWKRLVPQIENATIYDCLKAEGKQGKFKTGGWCKPNWLFRIEPTSFLSILSYWR